MAVMFLKPSGRIYYAAYAFAFIILSFAALLLSPLLQFSFLLAAFILLLVALVLSGATFLYLQYYYIHVEDEILTVREGMLSSKMVMIPFNKITSVETKRTPIESLLGIGTIMINTAAGPGIEVAFTNVPLGDVNEFVSIFRAYKQRYEEAAKSIKQPAEKMQRDSW